MLNRFPKSSFLLSTGKFYPSHEIHQAALQSVGPKPVSSRSCETVNVEPVHYQSFFAGSELHCLKLMTRGNQMREMCIKRFLKRVVTDRLAVESRHLEHKLFGALRHPFVRDEVQHIKAWQFRV